MEMKNHGGIDPQSLRSEIKGLVSMSPYTRIFSTSDYRDFFGQFDLSRERIENYISKNFGLKRK